MPANKYLAMVAGRYREVVAAVTGGTTTQAGQLVALDDTGRLDSSVMPSGVGQDVFVGIAGGPLSAGDFVAVTSAGVVRASAASGGGQQQAQGFVLTQYANGASGVTVFFDSTNTALTGMTVGSRVYLSDTVPGGWTHNPVSGTGKLLQYLGTAVTASSLSFEGDDGVILA